MGKTKRSVEVAYLDPEKLALLKKLATQTRIPRAVLMREAVDDLLVKHGMQKRPRRKP
jgi:Ribbon-helix-helix domain